MRLLCILLAWFVVVAVASVFLEYWHVVSWQKSMAVSAMLIVTGTIIKFFLASEKRLQWGGISEDFSEDKKRRDAVILFVALLGMILVIGFIVENYDRFFE